MTHTSDQVGQEQPPSDEDVKYLLAAVDHGDGPTSVIRGLVADRDRLRAELSAALRDRELAEAARRYWTHHQRVMTAMTPLTDDVKREGQSLWRNLLRLIDWPPAAATPSPRRSRKNRNGVTGLLSDPDAKRADELITSALRRGYMDQHETPLDDYGRRILRELQRQLRAAMQSPPSPPACMNCGRSLDDHTKALPFTCPEFASPPSPEPAASE